MGTTSVLAPLLTTIVAVLSLAVGTGALQIPLPQKSRMTIDAAVNIALTVDGFIATKDGGVDWLNEQPTEEGVDYGGFFDFLESVDVIVMGRKSFEKVVSFGKDAYVYGDRRLVVWTRSVSSVTIPEHLQGVVQCSSLEPKQLLQMLEDDGFTYAYIDGGTTIQEFLRHGLITRMTLTRIPLLLGEGISLFGSQGQLDLTHVSTQAYDNGFVVTTYDVNHAEQNDDDDTKNIANEAE